MQQYSLFVSLFDEIGKRPNHELQIGMLINNRKQQITDAWPVSCTNSKLINHPWSWIYTTHSCGMMHWLFGSTWDLKVIIISACVMLLLLNALIIILRELTGALYSRNIQLSGLTPLSCISVLHSSQSGSNLYFYAWSGTNTGHCGGIVIILQGVLTMTGGALNQNALTPVFFFSTRYFFSV